VTACRLFNLVGRNTARIELLETAAQPTEPNELCAALHNRMPAILAPEAWPGWLGEQPADEAHVKALLAPYPSDGMICWPVSPRIGNVRHHDPTLIEPITAA